VLATTDKQLASPALPCIVSNCRACRSAQYDQSDHLPKRQAATARWQPRNISIRESVGVECENQAFTLQLKEILRLALCSQIDALHGFCAPPISAPECSIQPLRCTNSDQSGPATRQPTVCTSKISNEISVADHSRDTLFRIARCKLIGRSRTGELASCCRTAVSRGPLGRSIPRCA
jgi:hypothetical protein